MHTATQRSMQVEERIHAQIPLNGNGNKNLGRARIVPQENDSTRRGQKPCVFVAAENRLLREALSRMLAKNGEIEIIGGGSAESAQREDTSRREGEILLLSSRGNLDQDLEAIRKVRAATPEVPILLIDVVGDEATFLQCIRAGVRGFLPQDASPQDVLEAVWAIHDRKAVCSGTLCAALFRYLEREATSFPSATVHQ